MNILIVGNIIKDVYLNLDSRTEHFETDKSGTKWLNLSFDAEDHHFFNRISNLGGAAVSFEVINKLGLSASVADSDLQITDDHITSSSEADTHRYILLADSQVSYLTPSVIQPTNFTPPAEPVDYLYIDRSANLTPEAAQRVNAYLDISKNTKLVIYLQNLDNQNLNSLLPRANLVFCENYRSNAEFSQAPELSSLKPEKLIFFSKNHLSYQNILANFSCERADLLTHLSIYSIAAATILACFILGYSVEESLKLACANIENSKLNSTLTLDRLKELANNSNQTENLELIAKNLVLHPKGILAADESGGSIHKKFEQLNIADTYENRRDYRNIFFTTPDLEKYVNGVILFDETARQYADDGKNFVDYLTTKRIIPGIKVDQGLEKLGDSLETYTKGLDGLMDRLEEYHSMGLRFAKWRAAFEIHLNNRGEILTPSPNAIVENCRILAEYAAQCQSAGLVPIVEPEVVFDGYYSIEKNAEITGKILDTLFAKLSEYHVNLRACILKVNMIIAGKNFDHPSTPEEVGAHTAEVLKNHVPAELAGIVFLSGGQTPEQATDNLAAVIKNGPFPWPVTFSFARALQDPALYAWAGDNNNAEKARQAFLGRLIANTNALKSA